MTLRSGSPGGLKGRIAPGDAHPYLALFDWENVAVNQLIATKLQLIILIVTIDP